MRNIIWVLIIFTILSCSTSRIVEVPVETVKVEYKDKVKYDSIRILDSVFIDRGKDTIYYTKYKYIDKYVYIKDTVLITDTVEVPIIKEVVKESTSLPNIPSWIIALGIIVVLYKIFKK